MEFYEVLKKRHSVRVFQDKEIEKEKMERITSAFFLAPSAGNLQAYKVYTIRSKEMKEELVIAALDQSFLADAPVVLVFCADQQRSAMKYSERGADLYSIQDATIAAAYAQLAAAAEGLSSVWVGAFDPLEVSRIVDAEPYTVPVAIIPIGYPAEMPQPRERRRIEDIVKSID
ncbi:nitroreductase family protein [Candidatus Micrarchaeota archaeon]|nr:nitroreductase family protein [Candidatus Micrarchaeota archaeon]